MPPIRPANSLSASYGVARLPYTSRLASRCARSLTGWKATATTAVASIERPRPGREPVPTELDPSEPTPTTTRTYTAVMNAASEP